jgi:hypothetical protein
LALLDYPEREPEVSTLHPTNPLPPNKFDVPTVALRLGCRQDHELHISEGGLHCLYIASLYALVLYAADSSHRENITAVSPPLCKILQVGGIISAK